MDYIIAASDQAGVGVNLMPYNAMDPPPPPEPLTFHLRCARECIAALETN